MQRKNKSLIIKLKTILINNKKIFKTHQMKTKKWRKKMHWTRIKNPNKKKKIVNTWTPSH
jgi:hypothetical protein